MNKDLSVVFSDFVKRMAYFEKQIHVYGVTEPLYSSEMHVICIIGDTLDVYGQEIARRMGFSKSAASQMLLRLEKRGLVAKRVSPDKLTKYVYALTEDGQKVYDFHENLHKRFKVVFDGVLEHYSSENAEFLQSFIEELSEQMTAFEAEWSQKRS